MAEVKRHVSSIVGLSAVVHALLGTDHHVADNAARDALTGLTTDDLVLVENGGAWVLYQPTAVDANGSGTAWRVIQSQAGISNVAVFATEDVSVVVGSTTGQYDRIVLSNAPVNGLNGVVARAAYLIVTMGSDDVEFKFPLVQVAGAGNEAKFDIAIDPTASNPEGTGSWSDYMNGKTVMIQYFHQ